MLAEYGVSGHALSAKFSTDCFAVIPNAVREPGFLRGVYPESYRRAQDDKTLRFRQFKIWILEFRISVSDECYGAFSMNDSADQPVYPLSHFT